LLSVLEKIQAVDQIYKNTVAHEVRKENFKQSGFIYVIESRCKPSNMELNMELMSKNDFISPWSMGDMETIGYALSIEKALEMVAIAAREIAAKDKEKRNILGFTLVIEAIEGLSINHDWTLTSNSWPMPLAYFDENGEFTGTRR